MLLRLQYSNYTCQEAFSCSRSPSISVKLPQEKLIQPVQIRILDKTLSELSQLGRGILSHKDGIPIYDTGYMINNIQRKTNIESHCNQAILLEPKNISLKIVITFHLQSSQSSLPHHRSLYIAVLSLIGTECPHYQPKPIYFKRDDNLQKSFN